MRLSINKEPGNLMFELLVQAGRTPTVFIDGIAQDRCVACDDVEGWIERHQTNENGSYKLDRYGNTVLERVYGKVRILLDPLEKR